MRKTLLPLSLILILVLVVVSPASAITHGERDNGEHPYVGLLYSYLGPGQGGYICSGTLIAPQVFLTAAHCVTPVEDFAAFMVSFSEQPRVEGFHWVQGAAIPHPNYPGYLSVPATYDIAVVLLLEPVDMDTYGALPEAGLLDQLSTRRGIQNVNFEAVGYGLQDSAPDQANRPIEEHDIARYKGDQKLIGINSAFAGGHNVKLTNNPGLGNGSGGTCSGDSGGPIFRRNENVVVAVNSFGVAPYCKGNDYAYRTDTAIAREFLSQFQALGVVLP